MPVRNITLGSRLRSKVRTIRKITTKDNGKAAITVDPKDPRTKFYTKVEKNQFNLPSKITHMTPEAHRILKENPELVTFLETELKKKTVIKAKLETKKGKFILREKDFFGHGETHNKICELLYKDKKTGKVKKYFVKEYSRVSDFGNAEAEFLAVKEMERLGFNIIKPQFATTDIRKGTPNIIVYDFTDLKTYKQAVMSREVFGHEILEVEKAFDNLRKSQILKDINDYWIYNYRYEPSNNVFVKRLPNGKLRFYFTDLFWTEEAYKRKREEYL